MKPSQPASRGFTLIELLTVIAIIAILAALLFPVFGRARESVRQTQCMTQMHDISIAMKQFDADNNKYPAALLGFVQLDGGGKPVPIESLAYLPLFKGSQKYLKGKETFACPDNPTKDPAATTSAVWPLLPDVLNPGQTVTFTPSVAHNFNNDGLVGQTPMYYGYDSYDTGPAVDKDGKAVPGVTELHYSLDWTGKVDEGDRPNQLKYPNPPEDKTVVTWCTHHVATASANIVPVLLLTGTVKPVPVSVWVSKGPLNFSF